MGHNVVSSSTVASGKSKLRHKAYTVTSPKAQISGKNVQKQDNEVYSLK
jgi:hypothetical protein